MDRLLVLLCLALIGCEERVGVTAGSEPEKPEQKRTTQSDANWDPVPAYWVWGSQLHEIEFPTPEAVETTRYYWLLEDLQNRAVYAQSLSVNHNSYCGVIRLPPGAETVLQDNCWSQLRAKKSGNPTKIVLFDRYPIEGKLQIDFDCPASLLPQYAARLKALREDLELHHLSVTALASWIDAPGFGAVSEVADELVPMFYDLEKDEPSDVRDGKLHGLVDDSTVNWITKWHACPTPWRAGLPNFQRLTIFNSDGSLVGHHRKWSVEGLITHPAIDPLSTRPHNTRLYQVTADGTLSGIPIQAKQTLAWRQPDESLTLQAVNAARSAGARGIVWFAHPASAPKTWHSTSHLTALQKGSPEKRSLSVRIRGDGALQLTNHGPSDLLMSSATKPLKLIIEAEPGSFGRGGPRQFFRKHAPAASLNHPETIRRMELEFTALRSGDFLTTEYQFLHLTDADELRWSIDPAP